jgi:UDPglucose 6-dehydrogenase
MKIGIIGYGMVGNAVAYGFPNVDKIICDPKHNNISVIDVCNSSPAVIFVCVPTPTDNTNYSVLREVLKTISNSSYKGLTVVKSTVLPKYIKEFDVIFNPEFLSRATYKEDFVNPPYLIISGNKAEDLLEIYKNHSIVNTSRSYIVDLETASLIKYTANAFFALKVTYMNAMFDVANKLGADYNKMVEILSTNSKMGDDHFRVPGPDGARGFGGPCLPKDTEALVKEFDIDLLKQVLALNKGYRG